MKIIDIKGRMVLDSRGTPTVEAEVTLDNNIVAQAIVPSGASTGSKEALELRDADGFMVSRAIDNVNTVIKEALVNVNFNSIEEIDNRLLSLDGTDNKSKLGANAVLAVSLATVKAIAAYDGKSLYQYLGGTDIPRPMMNVINGGAHANNIISIQEFMIVPRGNTFMEMIIKSIKVFKQLKQIVKDKGYSTSVGDEGGFAPDFANAREALDTIMEAITKAGYDGEFDLALDVAASEIYANNEYTMDTVSYNGDQLLEYYIDLVNDYPIISIEDPFDENDYLSWQKINSTLGDKIMIVGDDLFVTNKKLLQIGIDQKWANAILIKPNQIGTYTETRDAIKLAKSAGFKTIISHRSGDSEDVTIAHLGVGLDTDFIKTGSLSRSERVSKYNELLRIEERVRDEY